jgi:hypothetical protein
MPSAGPTSGWPSEVTVASASKDMPVNAEQTWGAVIRRPGVRMLRRRLPALAAQRSSSSWSDAMSSGVSCILTSLTRRAHETSVAVVRCPAFGLSRGRRRRGPLARSAKHTRDFRPGHYAPHSASRASLRTRCSVRGDRSGQSATLAPDRCTQLSVWRAETPSGAALCALLLRRR